MKPFIYDGPIPRDAELINPLGYRIRVVEPIGLELFMPPRELLRNSNLSLPEGLYVIVYYVKLDDTTTLVSTWWGTAFNPILLSFQKTGSPTPQRVFDIFRTYWPTFSATLEALADHWKHSKTAFSFINDPDTNTEVMLVSSIVRGMTLGRPEDLFSRPMMEALGLTLNTSAALAEELRNGTKELNRQIKEVRVEAVKEFLKELPDMANSIIGELRAARTAQVLRNILDSRDYRNLAELFRLGKQDQSVFPSTPAWIGITRVREGQLTVVLDHIVFFQREALRSTYKVLFAIAAKDVQVQFWKPTPAMGIGFTIQGRNDKTYRVYLDPPRGVNLTEVSAAAEQPGVNEVLDQVADLSGLTPLSGQLVSGVGEAFSLARSRRIARQHLLLWQSLFAKLASGQSAPFS